VSITVSLLGRCLTLCYPGIGDLDFKLTSTVGNGGYGFVNTNNKSDMLGQLDQLHALIRVKLSNERSVMVNYLVISVLCYSSK
jgi:hypothetical protein